jgi:hypothetical protein
MKWLPALLAAGHVILCAIVFGTVLLGNQRLQLLPVVVYACDWPISVLLVPLARFLSQTIGGLRLLVDAAVFMAVGSAWYYVVGILVRTAVRYWLAEHLSVRR